MKKEKKKSQNKNQAKHKHQRFSFSHQAHQNHLKFENFRPILNFQFQTIFQKKITPNKIMKKQRKRLKRRKLMLLKILLN